MILKRIQNGIARCIGMMVEPVIDWDSFFKDFKEGMSAYDLQHKYGLSPRQYRRIKRKFKRDTCSMKKSRVQSYTFRTKFNEPYITLKEDGRYIIRYKKVYYGQYSTLEMAKKVKKALVMVDWDKSKLNEIRGRYGLKPMRLHYDDG